MKKPTTRWGMFAVLLAAVVALAPWPTLSGATNVRPPKLTYERITLPNGLTVLLHQEDG